MAERSFKSWQGEDLTPEYDFTEPSSNVHVIWPEVEVGGRAWKGESDVGQVPLRDERGETGQAAGLPAGLTSTSIAAHNRWGWTENTGATTMARGWIGPKDYRRDRTGGLKPDRHREIGMSVLDANAQLQGIIVDATRGAETDVARVQWLLSTYLSGSPRVTTNISDAYLATGSNTVNLPAQTLFGDPRSILEEISNMANKQFFVTVDEELFYDGNDSTAYYSTLAISDRLFCDAPSPPGEILTLLATWDWTVGGDAGTYDLETGTYLFGLSQGGPEGPMGTQFGYNTASHRTGTMPSPITAGTLYRFAFEVYWTDFFGGQTITAIWKAGSTTIATETLVDPVAEGRSAGVLYTYSLTRVCPVGANYVEVWFSAVGLRTRVDNFTFSSLDTQAVVCFPPIWDVGPSATEDGQQLLSGARMYYGPGQSTYVYVSDPITASEYSHYEEALYAPESVTTAAAATTLLQTILARRKVEERNINVSIGPLTAAEAAQVKYGQLIPIKARAIAFADDNFFIGRIRQLRWTTPVPGTFFAHMQIDRPVKDVPYGVGNVSGAQAVNAHMTAGSNSHPDYVLRGILTTQGDLPYRGASDWQRLALGGSNTHLVSNGTVPSWAANTAGGSGTLVVQEDDVTVDAAATTLDFRTALNVTSSPSGEANVSVDLGTASTQAAAGDHTHTAGDSAKASGSGDVTTTSSLADVTGATLSLAAGTYIVVGHFDVLVNNALNDRTFEGHLDVGGVDENDYAQLNAPGLVNVRATLSQAWRVTLASTTTVKLRTQHSGGTVGDFTVKSTNTTIAAWTAGGALGAWTAYTPTWTTDGTAPSLGNAILIGRYKLLDAKLCAVIIGFVAGSTTTFGTGTWRFALPFTSKNTTGEFQSLTGYLVDEGTDHKLITGAINPNSLIVNGIVPEGGNLVTNTVPMTWSAANGDRLHLSGSYELD